MIHARQPRKLHDGDLFWPTTMSGMPSYPALKERISTEVAIVGGGITGAICAAVMARSGIPAVLVEGGSVASGSTAANSGLLPYTSDIMLSDLMDRVGEMNAVRFYQSCRTALATLAQLSADTGEDTGFRTRSSLYCASSQEDLSKLMREYSMLRQYGFPVTWGIPDPIEDQVAQVKVGGFVTRGDAEMNPVKLTHALISHAAKRGVRIFENTCVLEICRLNGKYTLLCPEGEITASRVVKATGYLPGIVTQAAASAPILKRTFVLATAPGQIPKEWPDNLMMWETARPYFYFRTTPDGRIIAGGADENISDPNCDRKTLNLRTDSLLAQLSQLFPDREWKAEHAWCGTVGESCDDLPVLGEHPEQPGIFHALGVGGNGTVFSTIAAAMLQDQVMGRENPLTALLSPARSQSGTDPASAPCMPSPKPESTGSLFV